MKKKKNTKISHCACPVSADTTKIFHQHTRVPNVGEEWTCDRGQTQDNERTRSSERITSACAIERTKNRVRMDISDARVEVLNANYKNN